MVQDPQKPYPTGRHTGAAPRAAHTYLAHNLEYPAEN